MVRVDGRPPVSAGAGSLGFLRPRVEGKLAPVKGLTALPEDSGSRPAPRPEMERPIS